MTQVPRGRPAEWARLRTIITVVGILAVSTAASAQGVRYTRPQQGFHVNVTLSERVKPYVASSSSARAPTLSVSDMLAIVLGALGPPNAALLAQLEAQLPHVGGAQRAQLLSDLGVEYGKHQRHAQAKAIEASTAASTEKDLVKKAKLTTEAAQAGSRAKDHLLRGVRTYKTLTDDPAYSNFASLDASLYHYGFLLQSAKYMSEARSVYDRLLKNFPSSHFVPNAHLVFADYFFEKGELANAEARYKIVLKFPRSDVYWYAMYKLGWVHVQLQRFQEALEAFFQVANATKSNPALASLDRAAKLDFVVAYAEIGKADKATAAFRRVDNTFAFAMAQLLGRIYLERGATDKAIYIHQELMKQAPTHASVCAWQYTVARAMLSTPGASNADKVREIESLARLHAALDVKKQLPRPEADECRANAVAMTSELGRAYHSESTKTLNPDTMAYASRLYKVHADELVDAHDRAEIQYLRAELLWTRAEREPNARLRVDLFEQAADAFAEVVKNQTSDPNRVKEATFAAVLAWKNALDVDPDAAAQAGTVDFTRPSTGVPAPQPMPQREQRMIAAFGAYAAVVRDPKNDALGRMRFLEATLYRRYHQYDKAVPVLVDLLHWHRDQDTAELAAKLVLDSLFKLGRYDELLEVADRLAADAKFLAGKHDLKRTLDFVRSRSLRRP